MPWATRVLTVYHGTVGPYADDIRDNGIQLAKCSAESDFGRGFYTTRILTQAIEFANERYRQGSLWPHVAIWRGCTCSLGTVEFSHGFSGDNTSQASNAYPSRRPRNNMNDLHVMSLRGDILKRAVSAYIDKCVMLLRQAFQRDTSTQQAFRTWIQDEFRDTKSPDILLHDPPLHTAARYLGIPHREIDQAVIRRAAKVARDNHW